MPELPVPAGSTQRERLAGERRIAVPGCYPTAVSLALAPGFAAGLLESDDVVVVAASGTSGAGKALKPHLLGSEVMGSMSPYGVGGGHRHTPEIEQNLSRAAGEPVTRVLHSHPRADAARHPRHLHGPAPGGRRAAAPSAAAWEQAYAAEPFVHLLPVGRGRPRPSVIGSNHVQLQVAVDERLGRVVVVLPSTTSPRAPPAPPCSAPTSPSVSTRPSAFPSQESHREHDHPGPA